MAPRERQDDQLSLSVPRLGLLIGLAVATIIGLYLLAEAVRADEWYRALLTAMSSPPVFNAALAVVLTTVAFGGWLIFRLAQIVAQYRALAEVDSLTGLGSRLRFYDALSSEIRRAERRGHPLALAYLDVDGLKAVNDTHGHAAGDALLVAAAGTFLRTLRSYDTAFRLSGDEFAIIFPETTATQASVAVHRIRDQVERATGGQAGLSVGIAEHRSGMSADDLVAAADAAMYRDKEERRPR